MTPKVHGNILAHPNSNKFVFEASTYKERVENKLAVHIFSVYTIHLDPKVRPWASTSDLESSFVSKKDCAQRM
jgi:hypothetical protein